VAIYDQQEKLVAISPVLAKTLTASPHVVIQAMTEDQNESSFDQLGAARVHFLALSLPQR
jgi:hypothetical protein